jgi:hypothetical protein
VRMPLLHSPTLLVKVIALDPADALECIGNHSQL